MRSYVIIGAGIASVSAIDRIRALDPDGQITVVNNEPDPFYFRPALSFFFKGAISEKKLYGKPLSWADDSKVRIVSDAVSSINIVQKNVTLKSGVLEPYDKLLIASGALPFVPPWPGADLDGVFTYRTASCARMKKERIETGKVKKAIVIGGGILGIEMVENLHNMGVETTLLLRGSSILDILFDDEGAGVILRQMEKDNIRVLRETETAEIVGTNGFVTSLKTNKGETLPTDMVMVAVGVRAGTALLNGSGVDVDRGVLVNENMMTNIDDVYSAGDVAVVNANGTKIPCGTWLRAATMGECAGENMAGVKNPFIEKVFFNASHAYKSIYAVVGKYNATPDDGARHVVIKSDDDSYGKIVFKGEKVIGGVFIGDMSPVWKVYRAIENDVSVNPDNPNILSELPYTPQLLF